MSKPTPPLPRWADIILLPLINLFAAFFVCGLIVLAIGENPIEALGVMIKGAFVYSGGLGYTLYYTTNFIFTGLAVALAFHCMMFNIGGEGQAAMGGLGAALTAFIVAPLFPFFLAIPLCILGAAFAGGVWGLIPGYLQAKRGSHIVITTIMFNFIASAIMIGLLSGPMMDPTQQSSQSSKLAANTTLPRMSEMFETFGISIANTPLNFAFLIALAAMVVFYVLVWHTRLGFNIRSVGQNQEAAHYAGINVAKTIVITLTISGAFAGLLAVNEILGVHYKVTPNFYTGYGFTGIAVALMGRNHPVGIFLAALLFGALVQGGSELDFEFKSISREMVLLIQGMIILFSGALAYMFNPPLARLIARITNKEETAHG